jgi:dihydroorotate dehydrogenase
MPTLTPPLQPLILSAPMGNYLRFSGTTATRGTFTLQRRGGWPWRLWRVARTLRYAWRLQSWRNQLGLPNPGLAAFLRHAPAFHALHADIVSVYGFTRADWLQLVGQLIGATDCLLELNLSCPNVPHRVVLDDVLPAVALAPERIIAKLPPLDWLPVAEGLSAAGVRRFHACNTLPASGGGWSGAVLQPYSLSAIRQLRTRFGPEIVLIGGGGIRTAADVQAYAEAGANHVAMASLLLNPLHWQRVPALAKEAAVLLPPPHALTIGDRLCPT